MHHAPEIIYQHFCNIIMTLHLLEVYFSNFKFNIVLPTQNKQALLLTENYENDRKLLFIVLCDKVYY